MKSAHLNVLLLSEEAVVVLVSCPECLGHVGLVLFGALTDLGRHDSFV